MNSIPRRSNCAKPDQDHTCVIHADRSHRQGRGHAEEHQLKRDPKQSDDIDDRSNDLAQIPSRFQDLFALVEQADGDRDGICKGQGLYADGHEGCESTCTAEVDEAEEHLYYGDQTECVHRDAEFGVHFSPVQIVSVGGVMMLTRDQETNCTDVSRAHLKLGSASDLPIMLLLGLHCL
jgi:hypothetical protein